MRIVMLSGLTLTIGLLAIAGPATAQAPAPRSAEQAGSVRVGTLEVRDISLGSADQGSIKIGRIGFTGFSRSSGMVQAETVEVENLATEFQGRRIDVPALRLRGFAAPEEVFRAVTEGAQVQSRWVDLLTRITVEEASIEQATDRMPAIGFEQRISGIRMSKLANAVVSSLRIGTTEGGMDGPDPAARIRIRMGEIRYDDVDIGETIRFATGGGSSETKRMLGRASGANFEMDFGLGTVRVERIDLTGVFGRAPRTPSPFMDPAVIQGMATDNPETLRRVGRYVREMLSDFRIERYAFDGLDVRTPQGQFKLASVVIAGFGGRGMDLLELKGMEIEAPTGPGRLQRFALEKLNYGGLMDLAYSAMEAGSPPKPSPEQIAAAIPRLAALRLAGFEVQTPVGPVSFANFDIELDDRTDALPRSVGIGIKRLRGRLDAAAGNEGAANLIALGYSEIVLDANALLRTQPDQKQASYENNLLVDRMGQVGLSARVGNLDTNRIIQESLAGNQNSAALVAQSANVQGVELNVADLGLADRFYADVAKKSGVSVDAIREGFAAEARAQAVAMFGNSLSPGSAEALARFVRAPNKLVVRIAPRADRPALSLGEMDRMGPPQLAERFTVVVESTGR